MPTDKQNRQAQPRESRKPRGRQALRRLMDANRKGLVKWGTGMGILDAVTRGSLGNGVLGV